MTIAHLQTYDGGAEAASPACERDLIERAKRDPEQFGVLYQRFCPMLLNYVLRRTGDVHTTEDLVGDVFVIAMRTLPGFRYRGIPLRSWLLRIATNRVNRWARRQRRRVSVALDVDGLADSRERSTRGDALNEHLQRALLTLAPRYQAVLSLYHMEGLSVKETAAVIGCREGTVRSRLARARDALRKQLKGRR